MHIEISNLGIVKSASIDLDKPLTLFCGPNSTGKTYVSYLINAICSQRFSTANNCSDNPQDIKDKLSSDSENIKKNISTIFGVGKSADKDSFSSFNLEMSLSGNDDTDRSYSDIAESSMLTVERNSIYTFNKELSLNRNDLVEQVLRNSDSSQAYDIIQRNANRYPMAVSDGLKVANDMDNVVKHRGDFYDIATDVEKQLLNGVLDVSEYGSIEFKVGDSVLPIHLASSIVKTLSSLVIYLKYIAKKGSILIIDEPEMNLHPDNQIVLSMIFSKLVNSGLRLLISTHSDYIVREFNNMIMADCLRNKGDVSYSNFGYSDDVLLNKDNVRAYYFNHGTDGKVYTEPVQIDSYGFEIKSIDAAINGQNIVANEFSNILKYDYEL